MNTLLGVVFATFLIVASIAIATLAVLALLVTVL